jgi:hypothetical protein
MATVIDNTKSANSGVNETYATSLTTPPRDTFHEVTATEGDGALLYWPEKNAFLAVFPEEYREFHAEANEHSRRIERLQNANKTFTEVALTLREAQKKGVASEIANAETLLKIAKNEMQRASDEVKQTLQPLSRLDAKDGVKMVELVSLKKSKKQTKAHPIYVKSTTIKQVLSEKRIYVVETEQEKRTKEKVFKDGKLNSGEIKQRIAEKVQDKAKFSKKWKFKPDDAEAYTGVLFDWARTMNGTLATFIERSSDPHQNIDLSHEAQLMRYAAGAGLEANFNPFKGNLTDKRDGSWSKSLLRGAKSGEFGIKANAQASFALAEGRVRDSLYLPHYAGWHATAEVAKQVFELGYWRFYGDLILSAGAGVSLAVEAEIGISYTGGKQGIRGIPPADKEKTGMKVRSGVNAELEAFAGILTGVDAKGALQWLNPEGERSQGKPFKIKPNEAIAEFKDVAKVGTAVTFLGGAGLKGAFQIKHEDGKFVIYAKMGACLGLGFDASMKFEVGAETMGEFAKCVAYQLKRADYHKIVDAIDSKAYEAYCQMKYLIITTGLLQVAIMSKSNAGFREHASAIMALALSAPQTINQLDTIAEHMTPKMGDKQEKGIGLAMIESCLRETQDEACLSSAMSRLAKAEPLLSKPFIWNSEPAFVAAEFGIEHPMYG